MLQTSAIKQSESTKTTCPYCGVGCGVVVSKSKQGNYLVSGDSHHPANNGRLCTKGRALADTLSNETRLSTPTIRGNETSWAKTASYIASQFNQIIEEHGPDAIGFYVSGQLLTEDYYVANKLMKGFIGSGNIDTNSRLCMSSPVVAHKKAFGSDTVPVNYQDLELADLVVLVGSNMAWCHPVLFQRISEEKQKRPALKIVTIDPRVTATSELSDLHLKLKSGTDLLLFNALLSYLAKHEKLDQSSFKANNFQLTIDTANRDFKSIETVAENLNIELCELESFFNLFAETEKVVTVFSQGINQSTRGVDQANAIINCHLATNRIGKPGMGPFSITGQPNAMGGREVGGMATTLASHLTIGDKEATHLVKNFWRANKVATQPGLTAVDMFEAVESGKIKAIWIMATNPVVSMPNSDKVKTALAKCPLVIVSESFADSETLDVADIVLPVMPWGEKSGTVTNAERRVSRQRAFKKAFADSKPDWWVISQVAKFMGFSSAFAYKNESEIFSEFLELTKLAFNKTGSLKLPDSKTIASIGYDSMPTFQWPQFDELQLMLGDSRVFADGKFHTADEKPNMIPVSYLSDEKQIETISTEDSKFRLKFNSGRSRDQWHTMTRTSLAHKLNYHMDQALVYIHPEDAKVRNITDNQIANIFNEKESILRKVRITNQVKKGEIYSPMHHSRANHSSGSVNRLVKGVKDRQSGQPAFKHAKVELKRYQLNNQAIVISPFQLALPYTFWTMEKILQGFLYQINDDCTQQEMLESLLKLVSANFEKPVNFAKFDLQHFSKRQHTRVVLNGNTISGLVSVWDGSDTPDIGWLRHILGTSSNELAYASLFTAQPFKNTNSGSPLCLCKRILEEQIAEELENCESLASVCESSGAGTVCGTCKGDIALKIKERFNVG